jgi:hypothetical protein
VVIVQKAEDISVSGLRRYKSGIPPQKFSSTNLINQNNFASQRYSTISSSNMKFISIFTIAGFLAAGINAMPTANDALSK